MKREDGLDACVEYIKVVSGDAVEAICCGKVFYYLEFLVYRFVVVLDNQVHDDGGEVVGIELGGLFL